MVGSSFSLLLNSLGKSTNKGKINVISTRAVMWSVTERNIMHRLLEG